MNILAFKQLFLTVLFAVGCSLLSYGQIPRYQDTLLTWSYEELLAKYDKYSENSYEKALIFSNAYLKKAKLQKDPTRISHAFTQIITISDPHTALKYCDSIIKYTESSPSEEYPGWAYLYKGTTYFILGRYEEGIEHCSKAYKAAMRYKNDKHIFYLNQEIGQLKLFWGDPNDAILLFKTQLSILNENNSFGVNSRLSSLYNLANAYIIEKKQDSSKFYNEQGLELCLREKSEYYPSFLHQSGEILFHSGELERAKDSLLKSIEIDNADIKSENTYTILGRIAAAKNDSIQALHYFLKSDEINTLTQDYTPETRIAQAYLRDYYMRNGDTPKFNLYNQKLTETESVLTENYKMVNRKLIQDFEIPRIEMENDRLAASQNFFSGRNLFSFILFISVTGLFGGALYLKTRKKTKKAKNQTEVIKPEVYRKIEERLQKFEESKSFTQKGLNLRSLSKKLRTNESYLSRVINSSKEQNVSNYLSDLRINHCVEELNSNTKYYRFDIQSLANEFGFNNAESFTKAFSKKTGNTPAAYIRTLKNSEN